MKVLILAHRKEIIDQLSRKLDGYDLDHGIIKQGHYRCRPWLPVQIASVQTLVNKLVMPEAHMVILDEAHHASAETFAKILRAYPKARILGCTATPWRTDGRGLGEFFDEIVAGPPMLEWIEKGYLVIPRTFAPSNPNLRGVAKTAGDFNQKQLGAAMDKPGLVGDIVKTWKRVAEGRTTVCFAVSIEHSKHITQRFLDAGVKAEHVDGKTPDDQRDAILARAASGETTIVANVGILTEGWDLPRASCIILARPTLSDGLNLQMQGRVLRRDPDNPSKIDCLILDHAGNTVRHGLVTDPREYSLDGTAKKMQGEKVPSFRTCSQCFAVSPGGTLVCLECGFVFPIKKRVVIEKAGELKEYEQQRRQSIPIDRQVSILAGWIREARAVGHSPFTPYMKAKGFWGRPVDDEVREKAEAMAAEVVSG